MKLVKRSVIFQIQDQETGIINSERFCGDLYDSKSLECFVIMGLVKILRSESTDMILNKCADVYFCAQIDNVPRFSTSFKDFVETHESVLKTIAYKRIFIADLRFLS